MERRGVALFGTVLAVIITTLLGPMAAVEAAPVDTVPDAPPATVSDFFPEEQNLSDCLGLLERPGCGSEARGGWRQTAIFGALVVGLGLIIWRISRGVRANRAGRSSASPS